MSPGDTERNEFLQLAHDKLSSILGAHKAGLLVQEICAELGIQLSSAQELYRFSQSLTRRQGFEGAVGAMLGVTAIMRGARPADEAL